MAKSICGSFSGRPLVVQLRRSSPQTCLAPEAEPTTTRAFYAAPDWCETKLLGRCAASANHIFMQSDTNTLGPFMFISKTPRHTTTTQPWVPGFGCECSLNVSMNEVWFYLMGQTEQGFREFWWRNVIFQSNHISRVQMAIMCASC